MTYICRSIVKYNAYSWRHKNAVLPPAYTIYLYIGLHPPVLALGVFNGLATMRDWL